MEHILVVIDMQKDFIDGSLGTKEAQEIVPKVIEKINNFSGRIICTLDTHTKQYLNTQEGKKLPVKHCIKNTAGWELNFDVKEALVHKKAIYLEKPCFGSVKLIEEIKKIRDREITIEIIGLCTDICVISNALILKSFYPEAEIIVDAACCAGVDEESHNNALEAMKKCQITVT